MGRPTQSIMPVTSLRHALATLLKIEQCEGHKLFFRDELGSVIVYLAKLVAEEEAIA